MIKIMIVDDEQIVRDGIKFMIDKEFKDEVSIVAMAKSGREAIELYDETRPQIVLMDIQMPGINGIDAIKEIKSISKQVKFVIISAYEQFEYAKSAVELGVDEYILKPINKSNFTQVLNTIIQTIKKEKEVRKKEIETQEKLDKILPVLEYGYIYSILMNSEYQKENNDYHNLLNIQKEFGYIMVIELGEGSNPSNLENKIGTSIKGTNAYQSIRHAIKYKCKSIVGPLIVNRIVVLVYEDMPGNEYESRVKAVELAENIHSSLVNITDAEVYIGIGSCYKNHRFNVSYNEAVKAISKITDENVLHIKDAVNIIKDEKLYNYHKIKSDEDQIVNRVEEGNIEKVEELLKHFFFKLNRDYVDNMEVIRNVAMELTVLLYTSGFRNGVYPKGDQQHHYVEEIKGMNNFYDISNWCVNKAKEITGLIKGEKENKVSSAIAEAMSFIEENYSKDLRLKDVAEEVAISPQYFSKIFKEELGVNFIDYLTKIRMEAAKTMLKEGKISIKEICYQIGYNDPNYFSRLFKKVEGKSPTEFV